MQALLNFQTSLSPHGAARHSLPPFLALEAASAAGSHAASAAYATPSSAQALAGAHHALAAQGLAAKHAATSGGADSATLAEFRAGATPERLRTAPASALSPLQQQQQQRLFAKRY